MLRAANGMKEKCAGTDGSVGWSALNLKKRKRSSCGCSGELTISLVGSLEKWAEGSGIPSQSQPASLRTRQLAKPSALWPCQ